MRREALDSLIPLAQQYDVGLAVMKPVSVGTIPAEIALPWLIHHDVWYNHLMGQPSGSGQPSGRLIQHRRNDGQSGYPVD